MSTSDSQESDTQILQIAYQLTQQFQISDFKLVRVSWAEYLVAGGGPFTGPKIRLVPPGWCRFTWDQVILPWDLKGKLQPEEWRPLLASSLIYAAKLKLKKAVGVAATAAATIFLGIALVTILGVFNPTAAAYALVPVFVSSIVLVIMGLSFVSPFLKSLRLEADHLTMQYVGKEPLMRVLEKINKLELKDKEIGGRLSPWTSLEDRIRDLTRR